MDMPIRYRCSPLCGLLQDERDRLMKAGFRDWTRKDFRSLVSAIERNGRKEKVGLYEDLTRF